MLYIFQISFMSGLIEVSYILSASSFSMFFRLKYMKKIQSHTSSWKGKGVYNSLFQKL